MAVDFVFSFTESDQEFPFDFGEITEGGDYEVYAGPYVITPKVDGQTVLTAEKVCSEDIEVEGVPYLEVQNPQGGYTATIAYI